MRLLILSLLMLFSSVVQAEERVRVSVLSLFRPDAVEISCREAENVIVRQLDGRMKELRLQPGESIRATRSESGLELRWGDVSCMAESMSVSEAEVTVIIPAPHTFRRSFQGQLTIRFFEGQTQLILSLPLELLVAQVVAAEMGGEKLEPEAMKALAVCVRSYICGEKSRHGDDIDFCDNTHCFLFRGLDGAFGDYGARSLEAGKLAAESTKGLVLSYQGEIISGYYHSCCGGATLLPSDIWGEKRPAGYSRIECNHCKESPYFKWQRELSREEWLEVFPKYDFAGLKLEGLEKGMLIKAKGEEQLLAWEDLRRRLAAVTGWNRIPAVPFTAEIKGDGIVLEGNGFGHKIGLCMAGAIAMAETGKSYYEILNFYFPLCTISD